MSLLTELVKSTNDEYTKLLEDGESSAEFTGYIDTGSYMLNGALSADMDGGFPNNKVLAIAGEPATGKTFFALGIARYFLDTNENSGVVNFDTESATTKKMMKERGIDPRRVIISEPNTVQDFRHSAINMIDKYMASGESKSIPLMFILDSLGNLSTTKELEDSTAGKDTRDMTRAQIVRAAFRVLRLKLAKAGIPMIVTNHTYEAIGSFIPQQIMSGGGGLKYAADQIISLTKSKIRTTDTKIVTGNKITITIIKSRLSRENSKVKVLLDYDTGLNRHYGLLDFGVAQGIVEKTTKGYMLPDGQKCTEKKAMADPDKYFTPKLLEQLNVAIKNVFSYGTPSEGEYDSEYESEMDKLRRAALP